MERIKTDVAVIGGGPAGSTLGCLLKKYNPTLSVSIFERELFPRDHIGESQLPAITSILLEMGVWDKVEAANFPIKLGGTYKWGATDELWHLNFIDPTQFVDAQRPAKMDAQRLRTAFQVDRSIFDKILLDHAAEMGCNVYSGCSVTDVQASAGFVGRLTTQDAESYEVKAKFYVDASGEAGVLTKALSLNVEMPTGLKNIAFWDYWQDARWAETIGENATRIQVMSLKWGWLWFIPITATRTSIGLVLPAEYYKKCGKRPEELYEEAVQSDPLIASLIKNAHREGRFEATKDWNYLVEKLAGPNWFLVGDSCGFADPILSAGMTLAHTSARKVAYSILELLKKRYDADWIRDQYSEGHRRQIKHHMRFAEFWYAGNGRFTDLKAYCAELASEVGLQLNPDQAFAWLGTGGFALDSPGAATAATFPVSGVKKMALYIAGGNLSSSLENVNMARANLSGVSQEPFAIYEKGQIVAAPCLIRNGLQLPYGGIFELLLSYLNEPVEIDKLLRVCLLQAKRDGEVNGSVFAGELVDALEALVVEGWVEVWADPGLPLAVLPKSHLSHAGSESLGR